MRESGFHGSIGSPTFSECIVTFGSATRGSRCDAGSSSPARLTTRSTWIDGSRLVRRLARTLASEFEGLVR